MITDSLLLAAINWHSTFFYLFAAIACIFGAAVLFSSNIVRMAFYLVISLAATAGLFLLAGAEFVGSMQIMIYVGGTLVLLVFGVMLTAQESFITMKTRGGEWVLGLMVGASFLSLLVSTAMNVESWRSPHPSIQAHRNDLKRAESDLTRFDEQIREDEEKLARLKFTEQTEEDSAEIARLRSRIETADEARVPLEKRVASLRRHQPLAHLQHQQSTAQMGVAFTGARFDHDANPTIRRGQTGYLLAFQAVGIHLLIVLVGAAYLSRTRRIGAGRARTTAAASERPVPRRGLIVSALLGLTALGAILQALAGFLLWPQLVERYPETIGALPDWLPLFIGFAGLINLLLVVVVWNGQRWGLYAMWIVALAGPAIIAALVPVDPAGFAANVIGGIVWLAILTAAICLGRPSYWSQME